MFSYSYIYIYYIIYNIYKIIHSYNDTIYDTISYFFFIFFIEVRIFLFCCCIHKSFLLRSLFPSCMIYIIRITNIIYLSIKIYFHFFHCRLIMCFYQYFYMNCYYYSQEQLNIIREINQAYFQACHYLVNLQLQQQGQKQTMAQVQVSS